MPHSLRRKTRHTQQHKVHSSKKYRAHTAVWGVAPCSPTHLPGRESGKETSV